MLAPSAPLAVCLCTALLLTSARASGSPSTTPLAPLEGPPSLDVDASALEEGSDVVADRVRRGCEEALADAQLHEGSDETTIRVVVMPLEGGAPGYRYRYEALRDGEVIEGTAGTTECRMCTESELVEQVGNAVARVAEQIPPPSVAEAPDPEPEDPPAVAVEGPPASTSDRGAPLGTLGKAGIGLIVPGVVSLAIGVGLAAKKPERIRDMPTHRLNTRPPGIGLAVAGTAVAMTGAILLLIDRRRARRATSAKRPTIAPLAGAGDRFGVVLSGRF